MEQPTSKLQCNILISPWRMDVPAADDWCFVSWPKPKLQWLSSDPQIGKGGAYCYFRAAFHLDQVEYLPRRQAATNYRETVAYVVSQHFVSIANRGEGEGA